ncbi:RDD family protein [Streptosporangium lutulentum]
MARPATACPAAARLSATPAPPSPARSGRAPASACPARFPQAGRAQRRLFAGILDIVIVSLISSPFTYKTYGTIFDIESGVFIRVPVQNTLLAAVVGFLYYWLLTAFWNGQTLGKKLLHLRVTDVSGQKVGIGQAALREGAAWVMYATCCLGWIDLAFILFNQRKQALHDIVAKTLVVDT